MSHKMFVYIDSPLKAEFIRSKYQFVQFINKQKDGEISSIDDLSKVSIHVHTCVSLITLIGYIPGRQLILNTVEY